MRRSLPFAVGLVALLVAVRLAAPTVTEVDAGELAAVAHSLGIAHPSGYPLFAALGRAWLVIAGAFPVRPILAMNLLSAGLAAGAIAVLFRVVRDLLAEPDRAGGRGRDDAARLGALVGSLGFAFHRTFLGVAGITEVHALQMFLDVALLHAIVRSGLWGRGPGKESAWLLACYLGGLCVTNHLTSALLLPAFALATWSRRRAVRPRTLAAGLGLGVLGASVYLVLPLRAAQWPVFDWGHPATLEAFVRHVTGAQYRVWMFASGEAFARNAAEWAADALHGFGPLLLLVPLGLARLRRVPRALPGTLVMFVPAVLYPLGYDIHDVAQYFLAPYLVVSIWIGAGGADLAERLGVGRRPLRGAARVAAGALAALPLVPLASSWRAADRSGDRWVESMARAFLATPAPGGVVLSRHWDVLLSPALYLQHVEGVRPDVVLLDQEFFRRTWYLPWLRRHHPQLLVGLDAETARLQEQLVAFERGAPYDPDSIQAAFEAVIAGILENGRRAGGAWVGQETEGGIAPQLVRVPDGLLFRLEPPDAPATLRRVPPPWPDLPAAGRTDHGPLADARRYTARMAVFGGQMALGLGDPEAARDAFARALAWVPADPVARAGLAAAEAAVRPRPAP